MVGVAYSVAEQRREEQRQQEILENFPVEITDARRTRCFERFSEEEKGQAESRGIDSETVCIIFAVENGWIDRVRVRPIEDSGIHGDFYNLFVDPGYKFPCGKSKWIELGVTEEYYCFERADVFVDTLCLVVSFEDPGPSARDLQKTICADVVNNQ